MKDYGYAFLVRIQTKGRNRPRAMESKKSQRRQLRKFLKKRHPNKTKEKWINPDWPCTSKGEGFWTLKMETLTIQ
jgi:hypothetical protein